MAALSSVTVNATQAPQAGSTRGFAQLTGEDFMNLLIQQLANQDPLQPMSNEEMLNQISTIREVEMNTRLTQRLEQLTEQQRFGSAAALIGKAVRGTVRDSEGYEYVKEGVVTSVLYGADGGIYLQLDNGDSLPLSGLEEVAEPAVKSADTTTQKYVSAA